MAEDNKNKDKNQGSTGLKYEPMIQSSLQKTRKSRLGTYQEMFIGKKGFMAFLKYEFLTSIFSGWPGAAGIFLRGIFFKKLFHKAGRGIIIGRSITVRHPHKITIGNNVILDDNTMLDAKGVDNQGIILGDGVFIGRNSIISCKNGNVVLGKNVNIGFNCEIYSLNRVEIGDDTLIAAYTYIVGGGHTSQESDMLFRDQEKHALGIKIGKNVWLGAKTIIMDGCEIGDNSIIGAGAVVTESIPPYSIAVGIPAKVIKNRRE